MNEIDKAIGLIHKELRHYGGTEDNANITEIITKRSLEYPKELFDSPNFYMQRIDNAYDVISYTLNKIYGDKSNNIQHNDINVEFITTEKVERNDKKDDKKFITTRRYLQAVTMIITSGTIKIIASCLPNNENTWMFFQNDDNIFACQQDRYVTSSITINNKMTIVDADDIIIKHIYGLFGLHDNDSKQEKIIAEDKTVETTEQKPTMPDKNKKSIPTNGIMIGDKIYTVNYHGVLPLRYPTLDRLIANLKITPIPTEDTKNDIDGRSDPTPDEPKTSNVNSDKTKDCVGGAGVEGWLRSK